jgi:molybdopterin-guanine dinucleotide biosynthesis protein A
MAQRPASEFSLTPCLPNISAGFLGVVLAGGKSSRMGQDKAMLSFRGRPLLEHQTHKLANLFGQDQVVVSGCYPSHQYLIDEEPNLGPLGGIETIVKHFRNTSFFLFLPVDMPLITEATLASLVQFAQNEIHTERTLKEFNDHSFSFENFELPLIIQNHPELTNTLAELRAGPNSARSVRRLCQILKHKTLRLPGLPSDEFANTNTLNDWQEVINDDSFRL